MARERKVLQFNSDGRIRSPLYHLKDAKGKTPYVYLGRDRQRAETFLPHILSAVSEASTGQAAQERADAIMEAPDVPAARRILARLLRQEMVIEIRQDFDAARDELLGLGIDPEYLDGHPEIRFQVLLVADNAGLAQQVDDLSRERVGRPGCSQNENKHRKRLSMESFHVSPRDRNVRSTAIKLTKLVRNDNRMVRDVRQLGFARAQTA